MNFFDNDEKIFDSFITNKYQVEESEFLEEQGFEWEKFGKNKWCWLIDNEKINEKMINKYFISVLLPYYIIKRDLARSDLKKLGFNPFLIEISHYNYHLDKIKELYLDYNKRDLVKIFGEEKTLIKLERAQKKINDIIKKKAVKEINFYSDIKEFCGKINNNDKSKFSNKEKFKYTLSRMYKFNSKLYNKLEKDNLTLVEICQNFLIIFIKFRFKHNYIATILDIDKRNLYEMYEKHLNTNYQKAKLEFFSKPIIKKLYKQGLMTFEMIPKVSKKYIESEIEFGVSKNTIRNHIMEIWEKKYNELDNNFSLLDLYLHHKFHKNIEKSKRELKYEILQNSITKDEYEGINYLSFETRIIRYIQMFGFSVYDGYDLYKHLINGLKASFHHLDFKKINDDMHNLIFIPDKPKEVFVNYIYHHHPIVRTRAFYDITLHNMNLLEKICKENDISYAYSLKNWSNESIELLKYRLLNDDWIEEIYMFLPKGNFPYILKNQTLEHFFKRFVHKKFYYRLKMITTNSEKFWKEYLDYRKELRDKSSVIVETEDIQLLSLNNIEQCNDNQNSSISCKKSRFQKDKIK